MGKFDVFTPENLEELKDCLKKSDKDTKILSGGTDLMIKIKSNPEQDFKLIDISGVKELKYIKVEDGFVKIGSSSTFTMIAENADVIKYGSCLAKAASQVGSRQIRNWGTIGGNIGNSSPAGDSIPALCALNAEVSIMDGEGNIEILGAKDVITGIGKNKVEYNRVIVEVKFPVRGEEYISAFGKIGTRTAVTIARLNMALMVKYDRVNNTIAYANTAMGALGVTVICSDTLNNILTGKIATAELKEEFLKAVTDEVDRAIPGRASQKYKRYAIRGLALDIWEDLFGEVISEKGEM